MSQVLIRGAGLFGLSTAIELLRRGHRVTVVEPGPVPSPRAASNDLNKVVRSEYAGDRQYTEMALAAIDGWTRWNDTFGEAVYEQAGVLLLTGDAAGFEADSARLAGELGRPIETLSAGDVANRFPAWASAGLGGYFNPRGGYCRSGLAVECLARRVRQLGGTVGVREPGNVDLTIITAGVWTGELLPELAALLRPTAHPILYLRPRDPAAFEPPQWPVFTFDITRTGWYGFPVDAATGLVKLALHDAGDVVPPGVDRNAVDPRRLDQLRHFLDENVPALENATLERAAVCCYTDTPDGHFLIDRLAGRPDTIVATGGSGHAAKMAPVLGPMVADLVEGKANPWLARFALRSAGPSGFADSARAAGRA